MVLSHSRKDAIVWSEGKDMLAWLGCHSEAFRRLGGVPATVRIDNEKTAVARADSRRVSVAAVSYVVHALGWAEAGELLADGAPQRLATARRRLAQ